MSGENVLLIVAVTDATAHLTAVKITGMVLKARKDRRAAETRTKETAT